MNLRRARALNLTPEEIRLIRDFIKPAPAEATPAPAINVGDIVGTATIPLPSQLMEKIPKLLGARFTTRNGAIIISSNRRSSRAQAFAAKCRDISEVLVELEPRAPRGCDCRGAIRRPA
jgi:hypothetical protein